MTLPPGKIAALYVARGGVYYGWEGVDPWDEERDARAYAGPHPVVAHPPCKRWGRFAEGSPMSKRFKVGDDEGCFAAALAAVRRWGGVIEHPQASLAWEAFGLPIPLGKSWTRADLYGGRSCYVDQGAYGHRAKKPTWLYAVLPKFPKLDWSRVWGRASVTGQNSYHSALERAKAKARSSYKPVKQMSKRERAATPLPFAQLLVSLARSCAAWSPPVPRVSQAKLLRGVLA